MLRLSTLSTLAVCAAGLASPFVASAQLKIAVINTQKAITETAEIKKAQNEMTAKARRHSGAASIQPG
jgi:Skp family chaperone for outer membrane proteins